MSDDVAIVVGREVATTCLALQCIELSQRPDGRRASPSCSFSVALWEAGSGVEISRMTQVVVSIG